MTRDVCQPHCAFLDIPNEPAVDDIAVCSDCGVIYKYIRITEMDVETIDGEPVPGTWRRGQTQLAWYGS